MDDNTSNISCCLLDLLFTAELGVFGKAKFACRKDCEQEALSKNLRSPRTEPYVHTNSLTNPLGLPQIMSAR